MLFTIDNYSAAYYNEERKMKGSNQMKKIIAAALAAIFALSMTACSSSNSDSEATTTAEQTTAEVTTVNEETTTEAEETTEAQETADLVDVNLAVLSGPTGVGAAKLISDNAAGTTNVKYNVTVETENSNVTAGLTAGDYDIACVATNVAANLYNKSGKIEIAAINTLGVLEIIDCTGKDADYTTDIKSVADLQGKTIYSVGQGANPEYVLNYILSSNGLTVGTDVTVEFGTADEIIAKMVSEGGICMLPQPVASTIKSKVEFAQNALNISDEWDKLDNGSSLAMGCVVVNKDFAEANPATVDAFLAEYAASIDFVNNNAEEAGQMIVDAAIIPNAKLASSVIPKCNLVCITGSAIKDTINNYYQILFDANPDAIGGAMPADDFYYGA